MEIRSDFSEVEPQLKRLLLYAGQAGSYNLKDWPHLKNRENFELIYDYTDERRASFEEVYCTGRDCAVWLSFQLSGFSEVGEFPTLKSYVDSFTNSWVYQTEHLAGITERAKELGARFDIPWVVREMIRIFESEIEILKATAVVIEELKESRLYRRECGIRIQSTQPAPSMSHNITWHIQGSVRRLS